MNTPPGNGGVQEYVEVVPDGKGGKTSNDLRHGRDAASQNPRGGIGSTTRHALKGAGGDGEAAAALAQAGAPDRAKGSTGSTSDGDPPLSGAVKRLGPGNGPGGLGVALPVLLVLLLAGAAAYELRRRRAGS